MKTAYLFFTLAISLIISMQNSQAMAAPLPTTQPQQLHLERESSAGLPTQQQRQPKVQGTEFPGYYYHRDTSATEWGVRNPKQKEQNYPPLYLDIVPEIRWPYPGANTPVPLVPHIQ